MENDNDRNSLIGRYLAGKMTPSELKAFEAEIETDSHLKKVVDEESAIYLGVAAEEIINQGHISIELLVQYQENRAELSDGVVRAIESHLKSCPECADEIELCELADAAEPEPDTVTKRREQPESLLDKIKRLLFTRREMPQPAIAFLVLLIVAIPAIIVINQIGTPGVRTATYEIMPGERSEAKNIVLIGQDDDIIQLDFSPSVMDDCQNCLYDFELYDPAGAPRLFSLSHPFQKNFAFEFMKDYVSVEGYYTLKVYEISEDGARTEIENYQIKFRFTD